MAVHNAKVTPNADDGDALQFVVVRQHDPLAGPLLDDLGAEYRGRYGDRLPAEYLDMRSYPGSEFEAPDGVLIIGLSDGKPAAGGAFRRYDTETAELKRIWTAATHRRRGYGILVLTELERIARERGYRRIYLTTGPRQPEAVALYLSAGYTALYDRNLPSEQVGVHPFEKPLY